MDTQKKQWILYGLGNYQKIIDEVIGHLNIPGDAFDIILILTEGLSNAFNHGNKQNSAKPIYLRCAYDGCAVEFEIEDCGSGFDHIAVPAHISDDQMLSESGRGLYLIACVADAFSIVHNKLIVKKNISLSA